MRIDTRALLSRLHTIESIAVIDRVSSTNALARRVMDECVENDTALPQALIVAREQSQGRGRNDRRWSSPAGKGIYATMLATRPLQELPLVPLATATAIASWLRDVFAVDARIKWPNDILAGGRKIAGILIEARIQEDRAYLLIGAGVNVEPAPEEGRPNATSIREQSPRDFGGIETAIEGFAEHMDDHLGRPLIRDQVLAEWRSLCVHRPGDRIQCVLGSRIVAGTWAGIDDDGRALVITSDGPIAVSAGDVIMQ